VDPTHPQEVCERLLAELIVDKTQGIEKCAFCPKGFDTRRQLRYHYYYFILKKDNATHPRAGCERLWNKMRKRGQGRPRRQQKRRRALLYQNTRRRVPAPKRIDKSFQVSPSYQPRDLIIVAFGRPIYLKTRGFQAQAASSYTPSGLP